MMTDTLKITYKQCTGCFLALPITEYSIRSDRGYHYSKCKKCMREATKDSRKSYYKKNKTELLADRKHRFKILKLETLRHYGDYCACCHEDDYRFLTIDHINGGGSKERRELNVSSMTYYSMLKKQGYPEGLQVLCYNCNCAKKDKAYCPHQEGEKMPLKNELHLARIVKASKKQTEIKYRKGQKEHGGILSDQTPEQLIYNLREEVIDAFVYLQTFIDKLEGKE